MSIKIPSLQRQIKVSEVPLEKLAGNTQIPEADKVAEISRQFEAILVRQVLNDAQKPVFRTPMAGSGFATDVYRDLMTKELADQVTKSDNLGLARSLQTQLQHQLGSEPKPSGPADPRSGGGFDSEEKKL